jgi:phage gpG-like protein
MRVTTNPDALLRPLHTAWRDALHDTENEAKYNAGVTKHPSTKHLRRSIRTDIVGSRARIGSPLPYARIRDRGGVIRARRKKYLHFKGSRGWAMVKQVRQIGNTWLTSATNRFGTHFMNRLRNAR